MQCPAYIYFSTLHVDMMGKAELANSDRPAGCSAIATSVTYLYVLQAKQEREWEKPGRLMVIGLLGAVPYQPLLPTCIF